MNFGERINNWLDEPEGQTFRHGKWRFWFVALIAFSILNAALTALVFSAGGVLQTYMGTVLVGVGALLAWLGVGALHYSDSTDTHISRGVAVLDSITLLFVVAHFSFLLWVYGHLTTLQKAEEKYAVEIERFNTESLRVQADNARIADALREASANQKETAKIEADAAYQYRKASERGVKIKRQSGGITASISMAPVELAKPPAPPEDSSAGYLTRWDSAIRLANFGELALAIITLIFIRVRSSLTNSPVEKTLPAGRFFSTATSRSPSPSPAFETTTRSDTVSLFDDDTDAQRKTTRVVSREGLKRLRAVLKDIAFHSGKTHFKVDPKDDYLWIRQFRSEHGEPRTVAACRAKLSLLDDAMKMAPEAFRDRLERFLRQNGFEL